MGIFSKNTVSVLRLTGVIAASGRKSLSLQSTKKQIDKAFEKKHRAVAIIVNSPGGSPAQSQAIANYIQKISAQKKVPTITFVEDVAASGGYWIALSSREIYALPSSIIGSIGVISAGFGFQELIKKYGIERRVHTAGISKSHLDPFKDENPKDVERLKRLMGQMHDLFKAWVKHNRKDKLRASEDVLFNGDFWLAEEAMELGLIDGLGDYKTIIEAKFGKKIKYEYIEEKKGLIASMLGAEAKLSTSSIVDEALSSIEERSSWNKFGL